MKHVPGLRPGNFSGEQICSPVGNGSTRMRYWLLTIVPVLLHIFRSTTLTLTLFHCTDFECINDPVDPPLRIYYIETAPVEGYQVGGRCLGQQQEHIWDSRHQHGELNMHFVSYLAFLTMRMKAKTT